MSWDTIDAQQSQWLARYGVTGFTSHSLGIQLIDGTYLVYSPGCKLADSFAETVSDKVSYLLCPNHFHHLGVKEWQKKFPEAKVIASANAVKKLKNKGHKSVEEMTDLAAQLPAGVEIVEVPDSKTGETWVVTKTEKETSWMVCDAFFNWKSKAKNPLMRMVQVMAQAGPGLCLSSIYIRVSIKNKEAYRQWMHQRLQADEPSVLIPCHGEIIRDDHLGGRLSLLVDGRLK